jgi:cyclophilin family peptidyl-prolyl cis-trans isomerase
MRRLMTALLLPCLLAPVRGGAQGTTKPTLLDRVLRAEDTRASETEGLPTLLEALRSKDLTARRVAIRAIGRLQRPDQLPRLSVMIDDALSMRSEAANAIAQSVASVPTSGRGLDSARTAVRLARAVLLKRLSIETEPEVVGVLARSLGRIPYLEAEQIAGDEAAILAATKRIGTFLALPEDAAFNVMHGLNDIAKARRARREPSPAMVDLLRRAVAASPDAKVRRLAMAALVPAAGFDSATLAIARRDADPEVRRGVLVGAASLTAVQHDSLLQWALHDPSPIVRLEAFRFWRQGITAPSCAPVLAATRDRSPAVALAAIDALAGLCTPVNERVTVLRDLAEALPMTETGHAAGEMSWHPAAHALVALARADRIAAGALLPRFAGHRRAQVREYAARAATVLRDTSALSALITDRNHNVQAEAITGMSQVRGHAGDATYAALLSSTGHQVVMAAATALAGSRNPSVPDALVDALDRLTAGKRENARDARMALLTRIQEVGSVSLTGRITPYLIDYDSTVAKKAAGILGGWSGQLVQATPKALPIRDEPLGRIFAARSLQLRITMSPASGGGVILIRLFPEDAPATVARLVRLAREHYYDGLSIHRIVPNFVIQGGSPDANEYVGDAAFMRDELGLRSHGRGTIGISTRGRDTGDAQFFVNLVDNIRLDHDYTVVGEILQGLAVADGILEGDVMAKVEVIERSN